jgi:nucleotide-binding universal stress UspA family protein
VPLEAVHAWRLPVPAMDAVSSLLVDSESVEAMHAELLKRVTDRLGSDAGEAMIRGILLHGESPAALDEVLDEAKLLVLGTHGRGPAIGALLGSTVQHMLHRGRVPIAVVPNSPKASGQRPLATRSHA